MPDLAGDEPPSLGFYAEAVPALPDDQGWIAPDNVWDIGLFHGLLRQNGEYGDLRDIVPVMRIRTNCFPSRAKQEMRSTSGASLVGSVAKSFLRVTHTWKSRRRSD